jgi:hypothetical protein
MQTKFEYRVEFITLEKTDNTLVFVPASNFQSFEDSSPLANRNNAYKHIQKVINERTDLQNHYCKNAINLTVIISKKSELPFQDEVIEKFSLISFNMNFEQELNAAESELFFYKNYQIEIGNEITKEIDGKIVLTPIFFELVN